jgi:hypothetical protein
VDGGMRAHMRLEVLRPKIPALYLASGQLNTAFIQQSLKRMQKYLSKSLSKEAFSGNTHVSECVSKLKMNRGFKKMHNIFKLRII